MLAGSAVAADPHLAVAWSAGSSSCAAGGAGADAHLERGWELAPRFGEPLRLLPAAPALAERCWVTGTADPRLDDAAALLATAHRPGTEWSAGELAVWLRGSGATWTRPPSASARPYA